MRARLLIACLLVAPGASASEAPASAPETSASASEAPQSATLAAMTAPEPIPAGLTVCQCVTKKRCWSIVKQVFPIIVSGKKTEVEGALPGRFFPGTQTWALRVPEKDGHFLRVECGTKKVPCGSVRDLLEKRLAEASLTQSVSREPEKELFDPKSWALTGKGQAALEDAKRCRPGLWKELAPALTGTSGWN